MNIPNKFLHPLQHDGVSRKRRQLAALLPAFVSVNERGVEDLLLYARKYARLLQFHDETGNADGDWLPFLEGDATVVAAILLKEENAQDYQHRFHAQLDIFESDADTAIRSDALEQILLLLLEMAEKILFWQTSTVPGLSFSNHLNKLIPSVAGDGFCRLIAYLRRATVLGIMTDELPLDQFESEWPYLEPPRSFSPLKEGMPETEQALFREVVLLRQLFKKFFEVIAPVLISAPVYLQETLDQHPEHEPHMALFLSFLLLMEEVRKDMNTLTKRHLDFYYREVLQLDNAPAVMDQAHLVLELAQGFANGLLETTDRFLDGKDSAGKDILFSPNEELVVTPASFEEEHGLKTLFFDKNRTSSEDEAPAFEILNAYGAPDANHDDRKAADGKWIPLGSIDDPAARFGFAIASPMFLLGEGEREITLRFGMEGLGEVSSQYGFTNIQAELIQNVKIYFSSEKKWVEITSKEVKTEYASEELEFNLTISTDQEAVVVYHEGLAGTDIFPDTLSTKEPVLLFLFDNYGLSTVEDFDLSMAGSVANKKFNDNQKYLSGEYVKTDGTNDSIQIFFSNGNSIGLSPDSADEVWETFANVTQMKTDALNLQFSADCDQGRCSLTTPVVEGDWVQFEGEIYRVNVAIQDGSAQVVSPADDSPSNQVWESFGNAKQAYNPETEYHNNDVVEFANAIIDELYVADSVTIAPIAPNKDKTVWESIPIIDTTSSQAFTRKDAPANNLFGYEDSIFTLKAVSTNRLPITTGVQEVIWNELEEGILIFPGIEQLELSGGDSVYHQADETIFKLNRDIGILAAPPETTIEEIWKEILAFDSSVDYSPNGVKYCEAGTALFQALTSISNESKTVNGKSFTNEMYILPDALGSGNSYLTWLPVVEIIAGNNYKKGTCGWFEIGTSPNLETHFFLALIENASAPPNDPNVWHDLGEKSGALGDKWMTNSQYSFLDIVEDPDTTNLFYMAVVKSKSTIKPAAQPTLWEPKPHSSFLDSSTYIAGDLISFNDNSNPEKWYSASYKNKNLSPDFAQPIWEEYLTQVSDFNTATLYHENDTVILSSGTTVDLYEAQADTRDQSPEHANTIWEIGISTDTIPEFDSTTAYAATVIVGWKNKFYAAIASTSRYAPGVTPNGDEWNPAGEFSTTYSSSYEYKFGDIIKVEDPEPGYRIANGDFKGIHPSLEVNIWDKIPTDSEIKAFENGVLYSYGEFVEHPSESNTWYRANVENQLIDPTSPIPKPIWEVASESINADDGSDNGGVDAGAYVLYEDFLFRKLKDGPLLSPSLNSPDWQLLGTIRSHNPNILWYQNMHVRDQVGKVYKAINQEKAVPAGTSLGDTEFWKEVSGSYPFKYFSEPQLSQLEIEVNVEGMRALILENDQGTINPAKPFMPFGAIPHPGSKFYLGSYEVFSKTLTSLSLQLEWGNLPNGVLQADETKLFDLVGHYDNYENLPSSGSETEPSTLVLSNDQFQLSSYLLDNFDWKGIGLEAIPSMFNIKQEDQNPDKIDPATTYSFSTFNGYTRDPDLAKFTSSSPVPQRGFLTLQLESEFYHSLFPKLLAQISAGDLGLNAIPNPPYTPLINSLTLDYTAKETIVFQDKAKGDLQDLPEQFFHLHPYGWTEFVPVEESLDDGQGPIATNHLVPRYEAQVGDENGQAGFTLQNGVPTPEFRDAAGNLFLGIKDLQAPQILNILVQVAEGSENPAVDKRFVSWSYLRDNRWVQFEPSQILSDDSNGFLRPGIIKLSVPSDITNQNTMLPGGISWIRAAVAEDPDGVGQIYDVRLHAVKATFEDNENDLSRLDTSLEANSLSKLFFRKAVIKKVDQPFASFGGNLEEQDSDFYQRVSERLRHKQRAITIFDYERLVLAQFPTVYQVKCITHAMGINDVIPTSSVDDFLHEKLESGIEHRPGMVQVIVLPDLRNQNAIDPLRPRVSNNLRDEIQTFLNGFCSGFSQVKVENPVFEEVAVLATVTLLPGKDPGFYLNKLNEDLITYLSPWRFDTDYDLHFGGELHVSPLINFIDELTYIDYVDHVTLQVSIRDKDGTSHPLEVAQEAVCTHTSASVLVSAPAHSITLNESVTPC